MQLGQRDGKPHSSRKQPQVLSLYIPLGEGALPVEMSRTPPRFHRGVPAAGEHTGEVLREFGCSDADLARLRAAKAIA